MAVTRIEVTEIYVATFNRAPDAAGLDYWVNDSGLEIDAIAASFFQQTETQELYPDTMSNAEFVNAVYNNVYNRDGDPDGAAYWVGELGDGTARDVMIMTMVNGAQGTDQDTLDNKVEVGIYFADNGPALTLDQAFEVMEDVTNDDQTVIDAQAEVDAWSGTAQSFALTTATDAIIGTDLDNTITGLVDYGVTTNNTLNPADIIDGGGGVDSLNLTVVGTGTSTLANMSNVETLAISSAAAASTVINVAGTTGMTDISVGGAVTTATINNVANTIDLTLSGGATRATTVNYNPATVVGGDDTMTIHQNVAVASTTQTINVAGIENIILDLDNVNGAWSDTDIIDADLKTLTVTGETDPDTWLFTTDAATAAKVIDLSDMATSLVVRTNIVDATGANIISGGGADTIYLNAGGDTVTYTRADQSQTANVDAIVDFATGADNIDLTTAIDHAGGTSTGNNLRALDVVGGGPAGTGVALVIGNAMSSTVMEGAVTAVPAVGFVPAHNATKYYVDVNTNGAFDAGDMTIDLRSALTATTIALGAGDFIV